MRYIPQSGIWKQFNQGDRFGDLWASYNLNLTSKVGSVMVSPRLVLNISSASSGSGNDTDLGVPCAFRFFTASATKQTWALAGSHAWYAPDGPNSTFVKDGAGPTSCNSNQSDLEILPEFGYLLATQASTTVKFLNTSGAWGNVSGTLGNSSGLHAMTYFRAQNKAYVVDDNSRSISSISSASTPAITAAAASTQYTLKNLVDGSISIITWIESNSTRIFIGTLDFSGGQAKVYAWDGSQSSGPNEAYTLESSGSFACVIKDDMPVIVDVRGRLLQLNGGTFVELDRLPISEKTVRSFQVNPTERLVHYNGMSLIDGRVNVLVNSVLYDTNSTNKENVPSGIWEYTRETGLYHKQSVGLSKSGDTITDYGQQKLSAVGALYEIDLYETNITQGSVNGKYLVGAKYFTNATATLNGIFYPDSNDTLQKAGYLVTSKFFSSGITEVWNHIIPRFRKLLSANDKIVVKYRTSENDPSEATITWSNDGNVFSTTQSGLSVGDEVELLQGIGSGVCAHITRIETQGSTYFITIDQTVLGISAGTTAKARFQTWKLAGTYSAQTDDHRKFLLDKAGDGSWVQFKIWVIFHGKDEIYDAFIISKSHQLVQ